jgi:hypothetical protein
LNGLFEIDIGDFSENWQIAGKNPAIFGNGYTSVYLKIKHKNGQKNILVILIFNNIGHGTNNVYQSYGYPRTIYRGSS